VGTKIAYKFSSIVIDIPLNEFDQSSSSIFAIKSRDPSSGSELYDSSTISFITISFLAPEVSKMPFLVGLLFTGLIIRTILGAIVVAALVFLFWKIGNLAGAYAEKIRAK